MKKITLLLLALLALGACQRYQSVESYIDDFQSELNQAGSIDIQVDFHAEANAIVLKIADERFGQNFAAYLNQDPQVFEAMEKSIEQFRKVSESMPEVLPELDASYQLWIQDHAGDTLLIFEEGDLVLPAEE